MPNDELMNYFGAMAIFSAEFGSVPTGKEQWRERLTAIKKRYALYQRMVDDGFALGSGATLIRLPIG